MTLSVCQLDFILNYLADKPGPPGQPNIVLIQKGAATLRWTKSLSDGGSSITSYRIEKRTVGGYRWDLVNPSDKVIDVTYTLTDLQPDTEYEFRIIAENKVGVSTPSTASRSAKYGTDLKLDGRFNFVSL